MDENIQGVEDYETYSVEEAADDSGSSILGKVIGGLTVAGVGAGAAWVIKNKDKIKEKREEAKAAKQAKEVQKHLDALAKLGWQDQPESKPKN